MKSTATVVLLLSALRWLSCLAQSDPFTAALEGYFAAAETDETSSTTYKYKNNKKKYKKKAYSGKMSSSGKMGGSGGKMGGSSGKMGGSSGKMGGSSSGKMDSSAGAASKKMSGGKMSYEYRWYKGKGKGKGFAPTPAPTVDCSTECIAECISVGGIYLVDADVDATPSVTETILDIGTIVTELEDGGTYSLAALGVTNLAIVCETEPSSFSLVEPIVVGSAGLRADVAIAGADFDPAATVTEVNYYAVDNAAPFSLAGDVTGTYAAIDFASVVPQSYTITCQAFCESNLGYGPGVESNGIPNPDPRVESTEPYQITIQVTA